MNKDQLIRWAIRYLREDARSLYASHYAPLLGRVWPDEEREEIRNLDAWCARAEQLTQPKRKTTTRRSVNG